MSLSSKLSIALRCALPLVGGLTLVHCTVSTSGSAGVRTTPINVQAGTTMSANTSVQPSYSQNTYVAPQPTYAQPTYSQTTYAQPTYSAPQPVVGTVVGNAGVYSAIGANWTGNGYDPNDYVSANMTMRARQFAAGYIPVTDMYRASMSQGQHQTVTVTAAAGRCYRILGVGGPGVQDLDLRLYDMNRNLIEQDVATDNFPVLGMARPLCLNWSGTFVIDVHMYSGGGAIGVQAFASS